MKNNLCLLLVSIFILASVTVANAQDKIKNMPGYDQYQKMAPQIRGSVKSGSVNAKWSDDGSSFEYDHDKKAFRYVVKTKAITEVGVASEPARMGRFSGGPARGRQAESAVSPDGKLKAFTKDRNMYISNSDGSNVSAITMDGSDATQLKYGIATWVYGEELDQSTAIWWSPDSKKVAFYKFEKGSLLQI